MITESSAHPSPPQGLGSQEDKPSSLLWQAQGGICPEVPEALTTSAGLQGDRSMGFGVVFGWRAGERQLCSPGSSCLLLSELLLLLPWACTAFWDAPKAASLNEPWDGVKPPQPMTQEREPAQGWGAKFICPFSSSPPVFRTLSACPRLGVYHYPHPLKLVAPSPAFGGWGGPRRGHRC